MTKVVNSTEYSRNSIFVGCSVNEDGEPLVEINGKAIGTVDGLLEFIGKYRDQQKAKVNVKWAATGGYLGPRGYKVTAAVDDGQYRRASLLMDVPANTAHKPIVLRDGVLYLDDVNIKDAHIGRLSAGATNIEGSNDERIARLQRELDDLKFSMPKRVEEAIASANRRNVRRS